MPTSYIYTPLRWNHGVRGSAAFLDDALRTTLGPSRLIIRLGTDLAFRYAVDTAKE